MSCGSPDKNPNSTVSSGSDDYQDTATYQCDIGYEQSGGNATRVCEANGNWTGRAIECTSKCCCLNNVEFSFQSKVS